MGYLVELVASLIAVVVVLTLHEFAHAFVAYRCGDITPKLAGRLTLNPLKHFDPIGGIAFVLVGFGWAKPVPINPDNFKHYRSGLAWTACAGVITNYICAFLFCPLYFVAVHYLTGAGLASDFVSYLTQYLFAYSLSFCVFNLLPFYPLDGFRLVDALNKRRGKVYRFLRDWGQYVLIALFAESFICDLFVRFGIVEMGYADVLGWIMYFATKIFGYPITALWGLIPW